MGYNFFAVDSKGKTAGTRCDKRTLSPNGVSEANISAKRRRIPRQNRETYQVGTLYHTYWDDAKQANYYTRSSHQYEIDSKLAAATNVLAQNHSQQMKSLQENVHSSHQAYKALEEEFRLAIHKEKKEKERLNHNLALRLDEIRLLANRDKEQTDTITDLVQLVKELKSKIEKSVQTETQITKLHRVSCFMFFF